MCNNFFASVSVSPMRQPVTPREALIRRLMEERGIKSVAALAERAGLHRSHVYTVFQSDGAATLDTLRSLARALHSKVAVIIEEEPLAELGTPYEKSEDVRAVADLLYSQPIAARHFANALRAVLPPITEVATVASDKTVARWTPEVPIDPKDFIDTDFDFPREVHSTKWSNEFEVAAGEEGGTEDDMTAHTLHLEDVRDTTHRVIKVTGRSMHPDYQEGWMLLVDLRKLSPEPGEPVAVCVDRGKKKASILGYWQPTSEGVLLEKANPQAKPVRLGKTGWKLLGTVQKIVDQPAPRRKS